MHLVTIGALTIFPRWHGTILAKLALLPQNMLNAYVSGPANAKNGQYKEGDLVANFPGCARDKQNCATEQKTFLDKLDGKSSSSEAL